LCSGFKGRPAGQAGRTGARGAAGRSQEVVAVSEPAIVVQDWTDLEELPGVLDELAAQGEELLAHAVRWVANRAGFEPSPVCVLRPLAEAMDLLAAGIGRFGRGWSSQWADLRDGVDRSAAELAAADRHVAVGLSRVS
jgi:hypothetical protein